jgi:hypothetical protein
VEWLGRWHRKRAARGAPTRPRSALATRYTVFREFLGQNHAVLALIGDLQAKASEGYLFDMSYVRGSCDRLAATVDSLVGGLVELTDGRFAELIRAWLASRSGETAAEPPQIERPLAFLEGIPTDAHQAGRKVRWAPRPQRAPNKGFVVTATPAPLREGGPASAEAGAQRVT